jgi:catechol 2,3-dioxygenase-like lactoylglutathione lyase family enzyme
VIKSLSQIEVLTVFVSDLGTTKEFYKNVFGREVVYQDEVSSVMKFGGLMINLLAVSEAPPLVVPRIVAGVDTGPRALLTIKVTNVDSVCDELRAHGVILLNGPIDRPWGRRTAAFEDPAGNVWEVAQEI